MIKIIFKIRIKMFKKPDIEGDIPLSHLRWDLSPPFGGNHEGLWIHDI
jgi:hypothetical protein